MAQRRKHDSDTQPVPGGRTDKDDGRPGKSRHQPLPGQEQSDGAPEPTKDSTGQTNLDC